MLYLFQRQEDFWNTKLEYSLQVIKLEIDIFDTANEFCLQALDYYIVYCDAYLDNFCVVLWLIDDACLKFS